MQIAQSLEEYTQSTSWFRVFIVCLLALSPAFALTILIELLPLRPPSEGWRANWVFWIRFYLSTVVISFGAAIQIILTNPASGLRIKHAFLIALGAAIGFVLNILVLAQQWCFPVPFSIVVGTPVWYVLMALGEVLAIGVSKWRENPQIMKQLIAAMPLLSTEVVLVMIYPMYNAIYVRLDGLAQISFVLVLPVIKYFMNLLIGRVSVGIPAANAIGMISVKLFDALYMLKCMGSAGSLVSGAVLIALDLAQNIYHLRALHKRVQKLKLGLAMKSVSGDHSALISNAMSRGASKSHSIVVSRPSLMPKNAVAPALNENIQLDEEVHELLLESERIVLVEFIEFAVPMFYAMYLVILFHLPNAKYYPEMVNLDTTRLTATVCNIAAYATLEFGSLLYVHVFLRWKLKISAFHMVAYILNRDYIVLQGVYLAWVIVVLQWTLQHAGTWRVFISYVASSEPDPVVRVFRS